MGDQTPWAGRATLAWKAGLCFLRPLDISHSSLATTAALSLGAGLSLSYLSSFLGPPRADLSFFLDESWALVSILPQCWGKWMAMKSQYPGCLSLSALTHLKTGEKDTKPRQVSDPLLPVAISETATFAVCRFLQGLGRSSLLADLKSPQIPGAIHLL